MDNIELDYTIQHITGNSGNDNIIVIERINGKPYTTQYVQYKEKIIQKEVVNQYVTYTVYETEWVIDENVTTTSFFESYNDPIVANLMDINSDTYSTYSE